MRLENTVKQEKSSPHHLFTQLTVILWIVSILIVCYMSLMPQVETPVDFSHSDKVWHALAYLWLSLIPYIGFEHKRKALLGSFLMIALGVGLEFGQYFIPDREFSFLDMLANITGVIFGIMLGLTLRRFYPRYSI